MLQEEIFLSTVSLGVLTGQIEVQGGSCRDLLARRLVALDRRHVDRGNAEGHLKSGPQMREVAHEVVNTLVVICTHGRSGMGRWVMGSVTDKIFHAVTSPLFVVRGREEGGVAVEAKL